MGLRRDVRELRELVASMDHTMKTTLIERSVYRDLIHQQQKLIEDLSARLLARNLGEVSEYKITTQTLNDREVPAEPYMDEDLVGTISEVEQP